MPFKSKRQQRAAFGGHIPGFSEEKAKEWARKTPDMKSLPERAPGEKGKPTLRSKESQLDEKDRHRLRQASIAASLAGIPLTAMALREAITRPDAFPAWQLATLTSLGTGQVLSQLAHERKKKSSAESPLAHSNDSGEGLSPAAIRRGQKVEMEHTKNPSTARQIAIDHLREREDYYSRLAEAEARTPVKRASMERQSKAHTSYFVEMNLAKIAAGKPIAPVLGEKRRSAGLGDDIPPQTDFAEAVEGDPVKAASDGRVGRISDRLDDVGIGLLAAPYAASMAGHGLAKAKNPKLRAAGHVLERALGTESKFGKSHGRELAGLALVAPGVTHTLAKGVDKALPEKKKRASQTVLSDHSDPPGYMMVQNLNRLADQTKRLSKAVSVKDNAEPWVESKIDRAAESIDAVHDYMKYKADRPKEAAVDFFLKMAKDTAGGTLSAADRDKIKTKNFALPKEEKYPIHDEEHAPNRPRSAQP
jgi:hypothetical protein